MTTVDDANMRAHSHGAISPELYKFVAPSQKEGAGKAGRRLRPQSRVRRVLQKCTRVELQVQPGHPGFPRAMALRLIRALPGERLLNAHIFVAEVSQD